MLYADVIVPLSVKGTFTYSVPDSLINECQTGKRVIVQFGAKKFYTAIIRKIHQTEPEYPTKDIFSVIDTYPIVNETHLKFWEWLSEYYMANIGDIYMAAVPISLRIESQTQISLIKEIIDEEININEQKIIEHLKEQKTLTISQVSKITDLKNPLPLVNKLIEKGIVDIYEHLKTSYKPRYEKYVKISPEIKNQGQFNETFNLIARAQKQTELLLSYTVLSELKFIDNNFFFKEVKKKDLLEKANANQQALNSLYKKSILVEYEKQISRLKDFSAISTSIKDLSEYQKEALENITKSFENKNVTLLHGVTSSGKTEIYIELIKNALKQNKQVLYLLPEIALTTQIIQRLRTAFGDVVGVYHSKFNDSERAEIWNRVITKSSDAKNYKVILGVRSSIFLPFDNLGLIIIDEEHESSYKQFDPAPRYNARDAAIVLANMHKAKVLLGTATPSIETYDNAINGKYGYVTLTKRFNDIELPEIILADVSQARAQKRMKSIFHPILIDNIKEALTNGDQIILFQNRRGFSPFVECNTCGWVPKCNNCDVSLTYHIDSNDLICHYCGYRQPVPKKCDNCNDIAIETRGFGTQKVEDEIKIFFPEVKVGRLDLDIAKKKHGYEMALSDFDSGETDILVGTQMITKGLDFENVKVVGVLNADNLLNFPDFRSFERSFQLMTQVSGRAGRANGRGRVIIQTSSIKHKVLKQVINNDFESFFGQEIAERELFKYPPFVRILKISIKHKRRDIAHQFAESYATNLKKAFGQRVLGPEEPLIKRIQNYYIREIIIKFDNKISLPKAKKFTIEVSEKLKLRKNFSNVIVIFNVDPL